MASLLERFLFGAAADGGSLRDHMGISTAKPPSYADRGSEGDADFWRKILLGNAADGGSLRDHIGINMAQPESYAQRYPQPMNMLASVLGGGAGSGAAANQLLQVANQQPQAVSPSTSGVGVANAAEMPAQVPMQVNGAGAAGVGAGVGTGGAAQINPTVDPWLGMREQDVVAPDQWANLRQPAVDPMMTGASQAQGQPIGRVAVPDKPGGLDKYTKDIFRENLNQFFLGMASGSNPADSLSRGAMAANAKHNDMKNANQTVAWLQSKGMDKEQAWALAQSPPALSEYLKSMVQGVDPMKQLQLQKTQLEIEKLRNPTAKVEDTALIRELKAAGLKEGTPEFQEAILANNRPKGMMIESDGQGGFKMVQGTDVSGGANMNVEQGKNTGFLLRAQDADKVITGLESEGTSVWNNTAGQIPKVGNYLRSDEAQQFDQAKRDFINAQLRQESGAVISPEEFKNAEIQYFPQPGDSQKVIEQKRANRQNAISGFRIRSGPGAQSVDKMSGQDAAASDPLGIR